MTAELSPESLADLVATRALFVSPHIDDVTLSCGGNVARCVDAGDSPVIVTVMAGLPAADVPLFEIAKSYHAHWGMSHLTGEEIVSRRRDEDIAASRALGARWLWLPFLDKIYRREYLLSEIRSSVIGPSERALIDEVGAKLLALWQVTRQARVYLPLALNNILDHRIVHEAGKGLLAAGAQVAYYEDFPYAAEALTPTPVEARVAELSPMVSMTVPIDECVDRRIAAIACYASQIALVFKRYGGDYEGTVRRYARSIAAAPSEYGERYWSLRAARGA